MIVGKSEMTFVDRQGTKNETSVTEECRIDNYKGRVREIHVCFPVMCTTDDLD